MSETGDSGARSCLEGVALLGIAAFAWRKGNERLSG